MTEATGGKKLRGVEAALLIWERVSRGAMVSESLRKLGDRVSPTDRVLAASLCYALARRLSLWTDLRERFMLPRPSRFSRAAQLAVLVGIAGLLELEHFAPAVLISSLVDWTKVRDPRGARVVNAVLRRALEEGPSELERLRGDDSLPSLCLLCGVPTWIGERWTAQFGDEIGRRLIRSHSGAAAMSLRLSPDAPRGLPNQLRQKGLTVSESPLPEGLRIDGSPLPSALPGYDEGWFTPQSESSISVGYAAADFEGSRLLDMCAGRCVKSGQIAQLRPDVSIEAWDLSSGRIAAARHELERLGLSDRVELRVGDALELEPSQAPDAVFVDAPCSGSGTWRRHPEGKWRLTEDGLKALSNLQFRLLTRAFALVRSGGKVVYSTCSLLMEENEEVVAAALKSTGGRVVDVTLPDETLHVGNGWMFTPNSPWSDGFYLAAFTK